MNKNFFVLRKGKDIDILVKKSNLEKVKKFFISKGFIECRTNFFHTGLKKFLPKPEMIDLQVGGLNYNHIIFFDEKYFFDKNYSKKVIKNLALILHLIVNKNGIFEKRISKFEKEWNKMNSIEKEICRSLLIKEFSENLGNLIFLSLKHKDYSKLKSLKWKIIFSKANFIQKMILPFILIRNRINLIKDKKSFISIVFLGVDGSGKTTSISNLRNFLKKNNIKAEKFDLGIYHKRTFFGRIFGKFYNLFKHKKHNATLRGNAIDTNYLKKAPLRNIFRSIDILLRYSGAKKYARKNNIKIIIFDRYFYDILFQSQLDFLTKILLKFLPKPDFTFYLYEKPEVIYKRKGERNVSILREQMSKFEREMKSFAPFIKVKSSDEMTTLKEITKHLNNKFFLR